MQVAVKRFLEETIPSNLRKILQYAESGSELHTTASDVLKTRELNKMPAEVTFRVKEHVDDDIYQSIMIYLAILVHPQDIYNHIKYDDNDLNEVSIGSHIFHKEGSNKYQLGNSNNYWLTIIDREFTLYSRYDDDLDFIPKTLKFVFSKYIED